MQGYESSSSHRSNLSLSLQAPGTPSKQGRRMTTGSQSSLSLPDGGRQPSPRPPSPLRNSFTMNSSTGIDIGGLSEDGSDDEDEDHRRKWRRSPSPASSVSNLAASFVNKMNSFMAPKSSGLPSDAELEAEAERERERSRREAEAILTREAQQRQQVEARVLAMMDNTKGLPPPPSSRPYAVPTTPSPSSSHKEGGGWWAAAKNRLTPVKDKESPITPAQQIILEAKAKEVPFTSNLNIPVQPPTRKPVPASPSSPTPSRPSLSTPNLSPSPMRATDSMGNSPSREAPPTYAQFTTQGTLDVPGTLLAIAKRFEKLEKWTVGHVRALEDRMNDVERWLVEKENSKDEDKAPSSNNKAGLELGEIRDEISELQGRVGELGREMAKMATSPSNLSSVPKPQTAAVSVAPRQASTTLVHETLEAAVAEVFSTPRHTRISSSARESTSPPLASARGSAGTRLPYPTGDYNSPQDAFSPSHSPSASINSNMRNSAAISGLPSSSSPISSIFNLASTLSGRPLSPPVSAPLAAPVPKSFTANAPSTPSPAPSAARNTSKDGGNTGLPPPNFPASHKRATSISPTPRKRYTVALGGPIVAPPELQSNAPESPQATIKRVGTPRSSAKSQSYSDGGDDEGYDGEGGETIGKSAAARYTKSLSKKRSNTSLNSVGSMSSVDMEVLTGGTPAARYGSAGTGAGVGVAENKVSSSPSPMSNRRLRAQSAYGLSSIHAQSAQFNSNTPATTTTVPTAGINTTAPLRLKTRSKSSERLSSDAGTMSTPVTPSSAKFVDPLLLRRKQEVAAGTPGGGVGTKKLAVGQLVAFFDKDKKTRRS